MKYVIREITDKTSNIQTGQLDYPRTTVRKMAERFEDYDYSNKIIVLFLYIITDEKNLIP